MVIGVFFLASGLISYTEAGWIIIALVYYTFIYTDSYPQLYCIVSSIVLTQILKNS